MSRDPNHHHADCDYRNSYIAKETAEAFGEEGEYELFGCNLNCEEDRTEADILQLLDDLFPCGHEADIVGATYTGYGYRDESDKRTRFTGSTSVTHLTITIDR